MVCEAFAKGCDGIVSPVISDIWDHPAMFYGVRPVVSHLWQQCKERKVDWYYADNAYFDSDREKYFRVSKNAIQCSGVGRSKRRIEAKPWRKGRHIVLCAQSAEFMATVANEPDWLMTTVSVLQSVTDRPIVVRAKGDQMPLAHALKDAHALVTWSSAAAVQALMAGIPVACSEACAAWPMATPLVEIESPRRPDGREEWAGVLADNQWTLEEIRRGECWSALNA